MPVTLYQAICKVNDKYSKGNADYSVTQLIDSARISQLRIKHREELTEDAADMLWKFFGSLSHEILSNTNDFNKFHEERLFAAIEGKIITGCPDLFDGKTISDYKFVSKYTTTRGIKTEWEKQLNIYNFLLLQNGWQAKNLEIIAIYRDAITSKGDPLFGVFPVKITPIPELITYISSRITVHELAKSTLPLCDENERWYSQSKIAVMKKGNKKAVKLFEFIKDAEIYALSNEKFYLEKRKGISKRCESYCNVASFCDQYNKEINCRLLDKAATGTKSEESR